MKRMLGWLDFSAASVKVDKAATMAAVVEDLTILRRICTLVN